MLEISRNSLITLIRGDSGSFDVLLNTGTSINPKIHTLSEYDKVYFGVMESNKNFEDAILRKTFTLNDINPLNNHLTITLESKDTEYLLAGTYYYEIKLLERIPVYDEVNTDEIIDFKENIYTITSKRKFTIIE